MEALRGQSWLRIRLRSQQRRNVFVFERLLDGWLVVHIEDIFRTEYCSPSAIVWLLGCQLWPFKRVGLTVSGGRVSIKNDGGRNYFSDRFIREHVVSSEAKEFTEQIVKMDRDGTGQSRGGDEVELMGAIAMMHRLGEEPGQVLGGKEGTIGQSAITDNGQILTEDEVFERSVTCCHG